MKRGTPWDELAEEQVLSAAVVDFKAAMDYLADVVTADLFHRPANQIIWQTLYDLWLAGQPRDRESLIAVLAKQGDLEDAGGKARLYELDRLYSGRHLDTYVARLIEHAARRQLLHVAEGAQAHVHDGEEASDVSEWITDQLSRIETPRAGPPPDLYWADELADLKVAKSRADWVIPGVLRERWRILIVAGEGVGKTMMLRQWAIAAAAGVHPFTLQPIPAVPSLLVDVENPLDIVSEGVGVMVHTAGSTVARVWHRDGGIDLRTRADRRDFEAVLHATQPRLVCMGPVYKLYLKASRESDEDAVREVQAIIDRLRARFGFALMLEHHAPKANGWGKRQMDPYGSSLWLRWPEFGLSLEEPSKDESSKMPRGSLKVSHFRGPRAEVNWPNQLHRAGNGWAWVGWWKDGMTQEPF